MPRDVDDARLDGVVQRERRESEVDGYASPLLLLPAVGIDAGERLHQGRLAVVDVTGGPDYEAAEGIGMRVAGGSTHSRRTQTSGGESEPAAARTEHRIGATKRRLSGAADESIAGSCTRGSISG